MNQGALTKEEKERQRKKRVYEKMKESKKRRRQEALKKPKPSREEEDALAKEALTMIREALSGKDVMANGHPWVPGNWEERYRRALGPYKSFLRSQPSIEVIEGDSPSFWTFKRTLEDTDIRYLPFQMALRQAWTVYATEKKDNNLNLEEFFSVMPNQFKGIFFANYESEGARKRRLAKELAAREAEAAQKVTCP